MARRYNQQKNRSVPYQWCQRISYQSSPATLEELLASHNSQTLEEEQHLYWQRDHLRRIKAGIGVKLLFNQDADRKILQNRNSYKGSEARYMPTSIKTPAYFQVFKDVTQIFLQYPTGIGIEIINPQIADSFKAYFDVFWKESKTFR
ncbi:hypothetical protein HZB02_06100 [Candidatus Woesearchaeota archaeon]|nr:hypothetical protein [Candidatus Woesearchaeota archaeon]